jgi:hypothetical protein
MAEIRCPMCGKSNPDNLDECQFCQARLKPITAPLDPLQPGEPPTKKNTSELEKTLPGWLREARKAEDDDTGFEETPAEPESDSKAESTDLLGGLAGAQEEEEEVPDWLSRLSPDTVKTPDRKTPSTPKESGSEDWLSEIRAETPDTTEQVPTTPEPESPEAEPETGSIDLGESTYRVDDSADESGFGSFSFGKADEEDDQFQADDAEVQPFITFDGDGSTPEGELPSWLSNFAEDNSDQEPSESTESETADKSESQAEGELPNWLSDFSADENPAQDAAPEEPLKDEPQKAEESQVPAFEGELPDWLSTLPSEGEQEPSFTVDAEEPEQQAATPFEPGSESVSKEESPDWLANLPSESTDTELPNVRAFTDSLKKRPAEESPPDVGLPNWLGEESAGEPEGSDAVQPAASESEPPVESGLLDRLTASPAAGDGAVQEPPDIKGTPFFVEEKASSGEDVEAIFSMDMPDWLSSLGPGDQEQSQSSADSAGESDESLVPGDLPGWVKAMRPVEAVVDEAPVDSGESDRKVEHKGPLAGLSGILPAGSAITPTHKPQAYAIKLQVSDAQQVNASLLERLLASEAKPRSLSTSPYVMPQRFLRWAIAVILILVIGVTTFAGTSVVPTPNLYPNETLAAVKAINDLAADGTVLLVFDYNPGLSGELEAAATPVVDHLMLKGMKLAALSSVPTGPALTERFMRSLQESNDFQSGQQYVELGYLPGGSAGVLGFASNPLATIGQTISGTNLWASPALENIKALGDFSALVLLTDEPEIARTWIEQAKPKLGSRPLILVVSAQAEPMVRPYYESGQVQGMVTGLMGGVSYEKVNARPGLSTRYWDAFSFGIFFAELMIVVGGLWSLISAWLARRPQPAEKE